MAQTSKKNVVKKVEERGNEDGVSVPPMPAPQQTQVDQYAWYYPYQVDPRAWERLFRRAAESVDAIFETRDATREILDLVKTLSERVQRLEEELRRAVEACSGGKAQGGGGQRRGTGSS